MYAKSLVKFVAKKLVEVRAPRFTWLATVLLMAVLSVKGNAQLPIKIRTAISKGNSQDAVKLLSHAIKASPDEATLYYHRGSEHFRINKIAESLADFDRYVKLQPRMESQQWKRGITAYYAAEYQKGSDQFKLYQTYHGNDVENAVWKAMCDAKLHGFDKASKKILPIRNDRRPPMMEIYSMFKGEMKPDEVLTVAQEFAEASKDHSPLFYAHQYVGLFYEANKKPDRAETHMAKAVKLKIDHYMWDVARVHLERLKASRTEAAKKK